MNLIWFCQEWYKEGTLYLPRYYLILLIKRVTLCALNCIERAFQFMRLVRTSLLQPKVYLRLTDPDLRKPAHSGTSLTMGRLPL